MSGKSVARSTPVSPVRESQPLHWFVRDIDIGDPPLDTRSDCGPGDTRYVPHHLLRPPHHSLLLIFSKKKQPHYMLPLQRTRSRHDCNFIPGSPFLNAGNFLLHQIFPSKPFVSTVIIHFPPSCSCMTLL